MHLIFTKRFLVVFILGFSSGLPLALVSSTLQAWFSDVGMSVYATGMLSLISLPYLYRFLWAPILDRYSLVSFMSRRRSWILGTQIFLCLGFNIMAWFSPLTSPVLMGVLGFILASLSATQDATIDAYRVEILAGNEFGLGASVATLGYRLAMLLAGGISLIIAEHAGWEMVYRLMGAVMIIGMLATIWGDEKAPQNLEPTDLVHSFIDPVKNLLKRPTIIPFCLFVIFFKLGEVFTTNISGIVMPFLIQGLGFSLSTIAYVNKILGVAAVIAGGLTAGVVLLRCSLYRSLFIFGLIQCITNALFVLLAIVGKNTMLLSLAVMSDNFAAGLGTTAIVALFMRFVDNRFTATQFSMLVALGTIPRVFSGPIGAFIHSMVGWVGLYQFAFVLSFGFIPFLIMIARDPCFTAIEKDSDDEARAGAW
ncbi:MAG: MFS transporter [Legionellaceae bacterium]|nr:MFS transporter [Legionellaceae bacterium]